MNERKYPAQLFVLGFISNVVFHFFWLFIPAVILIIVGIFLRPCLYIGLGFLAVDLVLSLVEQLGIRKAFLEDSDNPDFQAFQDAVSGGDWRQGVKSFVEERIGSPDDEEPAESDDEE